MFHLHQNYTHKKHELWLWSLTLLLLQFQNNDTVILNSKWCTEMIETEIYQELKSLLQI